MPVRGTRQVANNLRDLANFVSVPANAASRFALRPAVTKAKQNVRGLHLKESTGTLAKSLTIKKGRRSTKLKTLYQVGPDASVSVQTQFGLRKPVKYAHLIEFGTASGVHATPFLTPAYLETRDTVVKRFGSQMGKEMEKRAAKIAAKARAR